MNGNATSANIGTLGAMTNPFEFPKVGDTLKLVVESYGQFYPYTKGYNLQPNQRLIEVEVKSVQKVKVEYEEA